MAKEPRPEDLKSSQRRTGSHNGGSDSEPGARSPRKCGVRGKARGLEAAAMGKEGSSTTSSSVGEGSGKNILGGGSPASVAGKLNGCSQQWPSGLDILLMTDHGVEGLRLAGEGSRRRGTLSLMEPSVQESRGVWGLGVFYGTVRQVPPRWTRWRGRVLGEDGRGQGSGGPINAEEKVHFRPWEQGSLLTPGRAKGNWGPGPWAASMGVLSIHSTAYCHLA